MAKQSTKKKVTGERKAVTPALGPARKRARKDEDDQEKEDGIEQLDADVPDEHEHEEGDEKPAPAASKKKGSSKTASMRTDLGGEKGQKMFEDLEKNATEGRALERGGRMRNAPIRYGQDGDHPIIVRDESSSEDDNREGKKLDKGKKKAIDDTPNTEPGKATEKGKGKDSGKKHNKKNQFDRPHNREWLKEHKEVLEAPNLSKNVGARRVLAQRNVGGRPYYLLDWFPTWVQDGHVLEKLKAEWRKYERPHTFIWGRDRVYHIRNTTNDDSAELARNLLESVFQMFGEYMEAENHKRGVDDLVNELFIDDDWEFLDSAQKDEAESTAGERKLNAAEILRRTFHDAWHHRPHTGNEGDVSWEYGNILVQYNNWLDKKSPDDQLQPVKGKTVRSLIEPMFAPRLWDPKYMDASKWAHDKPVPLRKQLRQLASTLEHVVRNCPFLLKQQWPLMLVALFWWNDELRNLINAGDFQLALMDADKDYATSDGRDDSWEWRMVDEMI